LYVGASFEIVAFSAAQQAELAGRQKRDHVSYPEKRETTAFAMIERHEFFDSFCWHKKKALGSWSCKNKQV